jgi:hypothetical protein
MMALSLRVSALLQEIPVPEAIESPLPGGLASVVRFFLNFPQPLQIAGVVVGAMLALVVSVVLWRRRAAVWTWLTTRPRVAYAWAGGLGAILVVSGAGAGLLGWNYVQHDNGFCTGCHVMGPAFVKFTQSEHSQLECHDCHTQPISASARQLYLWVLERPEDIGEHAPVATEVCARCHIQDDPEETWQAIAATQGHQVHLTSDDSALANVQCVTCHAPALHRFAPAEATCAQSGCHLPAETNIVLGAMAGSETTMHCLGCHQYTAPAVADGQIGAGGIVPPLEACGGCHGMQPIIAEFMPGNDPHQAVCGACHNPHNQTTPAAALETCASAGCHSDPEALTPFHRGLHEGVVENCATCHSAHDFVADGADCRSCHTDLS